MATGVKPHDDLPPSVSGGQRASPPETAELQPAPSGSAAALGFASAVLATGLTAVFVVLAAAFPGDEWRGIEAYASSFQSSDVGQLVPILLLAPVVVVLVASIHESTIGEKRIYSLIGLGFAAVYAAIISVNYVIQMFVVRLNLLAGDLEGLALIAMPNRRGLFVALEAVGYGFFGLMALAGAAVFAGTRLQRWIRGLYLTTGATGVAGVAGALADQPVVMLTAFGLSLLAFLAAAILTSLHFARLRRT
jgi:hypothetical protein